jgi:hypothetical protein
VECHNLAYVITWQASGISVAGAEMRSLERTPSTISRHDNFLLVDHRYPNASVLDLGICRTRANSSEDKKEQRFHLVLRGNGALRELNPSQVIARNWIKNPSAVRAKPIVTRMGHWIVTSAIACAFSHSGHRTMPTPIAPPGRWMRSAVPLAQRAVLPSGVVTSLTLEDVA